MSWRRVDDRELLRRAAEAPSVCKRRVLLGSDGTLEQVVGDDGRGLDEAFESVFSLDVRATDPASVWVYAEHSALLLAVFVWAADGGPICSANDRRLVDLADRLFIEFQGETAPPTRPQRVTDSAAVLPHRTVSDDVDLGGGTVANETVLGVVEMLDFIEDHATQAQIETIHRVHRRFVPMCIVNMRPRGGPVVGELVIMLGRLPDLDPVVELRPDGQLRRSA